MSLTGPFDEKRDFIRMKIPTPLEASLSAGSTSHTGMCRELSGGGMQLELAESLVIGSEWDIHMASGHGHGPELQAHVKVIRCEPMGERYAIGLQVLEMFSGKGE